MDEIKSSIQTHRVARGEKSWALLQLLFILKGLLTMLNRRRT